MTNDFLTKNVGAPWLSRPVASGSARHSARTRFKAASADFCFARSGTPQCFGRPSRFHPPRQGRRLRRRKSVSILRVQLFGRPRLSLDGVALSASGRPKVVPLLAYLLVHRAAPVPRRTVANALWPDDAEDEARANLRRHLNSLHALLPPAA